MITPNTIIVVSLVLYLVTILVSFYMVTTAKVKLPWLIIFVFAALFFADRVFLLYLTATTQLDENIYFVVPSLLISILGVFALRGVYLLIEAGVYRAHRYKGMLDSMAETFYQTDLDGKLMMASRAGQKLTGYSPVELIGTPVEALFVDKLERAKLLEKLQVTGSVSDHRVLLNHRDGHQVLTEINAHILRDPAGAEIGIEGTLHDVTQRTQALALATQLGLIVENTAQEIFVIDAVTQMFTLANEAARCNLGYELEEITGMSASECFHEHDYDALRALTEPLWKNTGTVISGEAELLRIDGSIYFAEYSMQLVMTESRPIICIRTADITERKVNESKINQSQRLQSLGQLTGGVAHDFNNILQGLQLNIEMLAPVARPKQDKLSAALHLINRAVELTQRLLAFSSQQILRPKKIVVEDSLRRFLDLYVATLGENYSVRLNLGATDLCIEVDEGQLENAILNIVLNARDAMPNGGEISIEVDELEIEGTRQINSVALTTGRYILISISDQGVGIEKGNIERVLEPFFTTKLRDKGTGLGLSMVYGFTQQSNGGMELTSKVGVGTKVTLYFPAVDYTQKLEVLVNEPVATTECKTILLIEDDESVAQVTNEILQHLGFIVVVAKDKLTAEVAVAGRNIDVVLSDVNLPGGYTGPEIVTYLDKPLAGVPVVFMSGHPAELSGRNSASEDRLWFLPKPFGKNKLDEILRKALMYAEKF